jgi:hypothetical protein
MICLTSGDKDKIPKNHSKKKKGARRRGRKEQSTKKREYKNENAKINGTPIKLRREQRAKVKESDHAKFFKIAITTATDATANATRRPWP